MARMHHVHGWASPQNPLIPHVKNDVVNCPTGFGNCTKCIYLYNAIHNLPEQTFLVADADGYKIGCCLRIILSREAYRETTMFIRVKLHYTDPLTQQ